MQSRDNARDKRRKYSGPNRVRYALEPGAPSPMVYSTGTMGGRRVLNFAAYARRRCPKLGNQEDHHGVTCNGLCDECKYDYQTDDLHFVRSPQWKPGIAVFTCDHALKEIDDARLGPYRTWRATWTMIFLRHIAVKAAAQALDMFGRTWLLSVPKPIYLPEFDMDEVLALVPRLSLISFHGREHGQLEEEHDDE
jgi:hypothetical protein